MINAEPQAAWNCFCERKGGGAGTMTCSAADHSYARFARTWQLFGLRGSSTNKAFARAESIRSICIGPIFGI